MASYLKNLFERDDFQRFRTRRHRRRFSLIQGAVTLGLIGLAPALATPAHILAWRWPDDEDSVSMPAGLSASG